MTCEQLQQAFTVKTYGMWGPEKYQAFSGVRGDQCARTAEFVTCWVVQRILLC